MSSLIQASGLTSFALPGAQIVPTIASNALTATIKTAAGFAPSPTAPLFIAMQKTAGDGSLYEGRPLASALSVVISSGSTLGAVGANTPFRVWLAIFDNAGTPILAARNCSTASATFALTEFGVANATQDDGAGTSDLAGAFYASVNITAKPYRLIGYMDWNTGLVTPGTWNALPTLSQMKGPGIPSPGDRIPQGYSFENSFVNNATALPYDNTTPQSDEGFEVLTNTFTPLSPVNFVENECILQASCSAVDVVSAALFKDSAVDALAAVAVHVPAVDVPVQLVMLDRHQIGSSAQTTYRIRAGANSGTFGLNGTSAALRFNNTTRSFLRTGELMA